MRSLTNARVLIVEDNWLQAAELAHQFTELGAEVIGPATSLAAAMNLAPRAEMAVLDIDLRGETVFPVADRLHDRGVPIVFYTAYTEIRVPTRFRFASRLQKPSTATEIAETVRTAPVAPPTPDPDDVTALLPRLRLAARLLLDDVQAADRLVELALLRALKTDPPEDESRSAWLNRLLLDVAEERGRDMLN